MSDISNVIGIISAKGGVGKTTLTANLGLAMADFNHEPTLIDGNVKAGSLGLHLGLYKNRNMDLQESYEDGNLTWKGIYVHPEYNIKFMPSPLYATDIDLDLEQLIGNIRQNRNPVLIDFPPALSEKAIKTIEVIDRAIVISTPKIPALTDAMRTIRTLRERNKEIIGVVLNKKGESKNELSRREIEKACGEKVIAEIPYDDNVMKEEDKGIPVIDMKPLSPASKKIKELGANLLGVEWSPSGWIDRIKSFFTRKNTEKVKRKPLPMDKNLENRKKEHKSSQKKQTNHKFTCDICGDQFDSERALNIHQAKSHKKEMKKVKEKLENAKEKLSEED